MIFDTICLAGLVLMFVVLVKGLKQSAGSNEDINIPPVINNVNPKQSCWQKDPTFSPLARDRLEVLEIWEKCAKDPSVPPPILPAKPHHYFGDEHGPDRID